MTQRSCRLGPWDWAIVACGLAIVVCLEVLKPQPFWANEPAAGLTADEAFVHWQENAEGGAAFARGDRGAFGWSDNQPDAATARRFAIAYCQMWTQDGCKVTHTHDERVLHPEIGRLVSPKIARAFETLKDRPGPKAFAMNDHGYYGTFYRAKSRRAARNGAIAKCEGGKGRYPKGIKPLPCRVVYDGG